MKRLILAALAAFTIPAAPAAAQSVAGCGTVAVAKGDRADRAKLTAQIACFEKAGVAATGAVEARRVLLAALAPAPTPSPAVVWTECAKEGAACGFEGTARVRYGAGSRWAEKTATGSIGCYNGVFGDPAPGVAKVCQTTAAKVIAGASAPPAVSAIAVVAPGARPWPLPAQPTTRRGLLGVNVAATPWFGGDQTFANLLMGGEWRDFTRAELGPDGYPRPDLINAGRAAMLILTPPYTSFTRDTPVRRTWEGKGAIAFEGNVKTGDRGSGRTFAFTWKANTNNQDMNWLKVTRSDPADPIRNIDCRAEGIETVGIFTKQAVDYYSLFGTLRFLDPSGVNGNGPWRWASRTLPTDITQGGDGGWALETMAALNAATGTDGWYNVSWNADEDYQRRMAQAVHDLTPVDRHVYVEMSNEVWNFSFGVATQIRDEGKALNVSRDGDGFKSGLMLYAKRTGDLMRIWTEVFKDRPGQLIRVVGTQSSNAWVTGVVVAESGLGASGLIDAVAGAPYFGGDVTSKNPALTDLDRMFPLLAADIPRVLAENAGNRPIAERYGLRMISYEAGQHLVSETPGVVEGPNRDPRMADLYRAYIPQVIAANGGDLVVLFNATGRMSKWGAWGLREYAGQPIAETPKLKAVEDWLAGK